MRTIQRDIASAILISKDGKVFLAQKKSGGVFQGTWTIPGGGIDAGETREQAMTREVFEETGINVQEYPSELVDIGQGSSEKTLKDTGDRVMVDMTFYDFRVTLSKDATNIAVQLADEFAKYGWFTTQEISTLQLSPPCEKLFRKLGYLP